jgi:hypothetical protein
MSANKYGYVVVVSDEDGPAELCERNGTVYFAEDGKRFADDKAVIVAQEYTAANPGRGTEYGLRIQNRPRRTRGEHRAYVKEREAYRREAEAEAEEAMRGYYR